MQTPTPSPAPFENATYGGHGQFNQALLPQLPAIHQALHNIAVSLPQSPSLEGQTPARPLHSLHFSNQATFYMNPAGNSNSPPTSAHTFSPGDAKLTAPQPVAPAPPQVPQSQTQQTQVSQDLQSARNRRDQIQWHGPPPPQIADIEQIASRLRAAIDDWSGYYDSDRGIERLIENRPDTIDDKDKRDAAYWAAVSSFIPRGT